MIQLYNSKHTGWEDGDISVNYFELFADESSELPTDPYYFSSDEGRYKIAQGSVAYIISNSEIYVYDSTGTWVQNASSGGGSGGTVTKVTAGIGLTTADSSGEITTAGTININLASATALTGNTIFNVGVNSNNQLVVKIPDATSSSSGLLPSLPSSDASTKFLNGQGSWATPSYTTVAEGSTDGTISVNGTDVAVHGLSSAAYTASTSYIAAAGSTPTEDDIVTWNTTKTTVKDSGKKIEASASGISDDDAKIPTSKNIKTNVSTTSVLTGYTASTATTWQDVAAADTIQEAIKKVEKDANLNKNNISTEQAKTVGMTAGGSDYITVGGIRVYVSATAPTGTIPTGSIWIGG